MKNYESNTTINLVILHTPVKAAALWSSGCQRHLRFAHRRPKINRSNKEPEEAPKTYDSQANFP